MLQRLGDMRMASIRIRGVEEAQAMVSTVLGAATVAR